MPHAAVRLSDSTLLSAFAPCAGSQNGARRLVSAWRGDGRRLRHLGFASAKVAIGDSVPITHPPSIVDHDALSGRAGDESQLCERAASRHSRKLTGLSNAEMITTYVAAIAALVALPASASTP